ncbi:MAG: hypothetical protein ACLRYE_03895 [Gemmiger formicilis]|uniref:hypothetical protein n=1 Tax=Gemmiger formicilis TaxID=745368 RepID=UPI0039A3D8B7
MTAANQRKQKIFNSLVPLRIGYDSIFSIYIYLVFICAGFTCTGKSRLSVNAFVVKQKIPESGILGDIWLDEYRADYLL